jgi:hypothetical protein
MRFNDIAQLNAPITSPSTSPNQTIIIEGDEDVISLGSEVGQEEPIEADDEDDDDQQYYEVPRIRLPIQKQFQTRQCARISTGPRYF